MPGRLFLRRSVVEVAADLDLEAGALAEEPPRANIAPGQQVVTLTADGLERSRWGIVPVGRVNARGRPVMETLINARSETVFDKSAYLGMGRAVVPADGWYEWTGEKRRKTAWAISDAAGGLLWFAAVRDVWKAPGGFSLPQVAIVTCPPNGDVAPIHHRMGVLLERVDLAAWLEGDEAQARALMRPWPDGRLRIEQARHVDWEGP